VAIVLFLFLVYNDAIGLCDGAQLFGVDFKSWLDVMYRARVGAKYLLVDLYLETLPTSCLKF
jgi:hypothetical protein